MAKKILIQMGHNPPRQPGFESGTGTSGEIELVREIGQRLNALLEDDNRFDPTLCPGQMPVSGWSGDIFMSLHADGSGTPSVRGYSIGWPPAELGPKTRSFTALLAKNYEELPGHPPHHKDNYTRDMQGYYGFHHCTAPVKVLFEHGFLTNSVERAWLTTHEALIAQSHYEAILAYFSLSRPDTAPTSGDEQLWQLWATGEGKLYAKYDPYEGPRPDVQNPAPPEWNVRLVKKLKHREEGLRLQITQLQNQLNK